MSTNENNNRRENDINYFNELKILHTKLDTHMREEERYHREVGEKLVSLETNMESMTDYVKKVTQILERITVIEERDKTHIKIIDEITNLLKTIETRVQSNKEEVNKEIAFVDKKVSKWIYTFSGGFAVVAALWMGLSNSVGEKLDEVSTVLDKVKIHLEVDRPTGWPPQQNQQPFNR